MDAGNGSGWNLLQELAGHTEAVLGLAVSHNGKHVFSASADRTVRMWRVGLGRGYLLQGFFGLADRVNDVCFVNTHSRREGGNLIVAASHDRTARAYAIEEARSIRVLSGHTDQVNSVSVCPGSFVVTASNDTTVRVWNPSDPTGKCVKVIEGHTDAVTCVCITAPEASAVYVISASQDKSVRLWDLNNGFASAGQLGPHPDSVLSVCTSFREVFVNGKLDSYVVTGSQDGLVRVWLLSSRQLCYKLRHLGVTCVALSRDSSRIATGSRDRTACIWNISDGKVHKTLSGEHNGPVNSVCFTPDGTHVLTASQDSTAIVWLVIHGVPVRKLTNGHTYVPVSL